MTDAVIWHDLECGVYAADLALWLELAAANPGPVLDVGAGTGRVAIPLARAGHTVHALDCDGELLDALRARGRGHPIHCVRADACAFLLPARFGLCIVPMQTIHLLADRAGFLRCVNACLAPAGLLAIALLGDGVEAFEAELEPERCEHAGVHYASTPTALRIDRATILLERRRERTAAGGLPMPEPVRAEQNVVALNRLTPSALAGEGSRAGFAAAGSRTVSPTADRAGSVVLLMRKAGTAEPQLQPATPASTEIAP